MALVNSNASTVTINNDWYKKYKMIQFDLVMKPSTLISVHDIIRWGWGIVQGGQAYGWSSKY